VFHLELLCGEVAIENISSSEFPPSLRSFSIGNITRYYWKATVQGHLASFLAGLHPVGGKLHRTEQDPPGRGFCLESAQIHATFDTSSSSTTEIFEAVLDIYPENNGK
jgi:hypothetical protein